MKNSRKVHLFIDISNILVGAKEIAESKARRLNVQALLNTVSGQREVARKVCAVILSSCLSVFMIATLNKIPKIFLLS